MSAIRATLCSAVSGSVPATSTFCSAVGASPSCDQVMQVTGSLVASSIRTLPAGKWSTAIRPPTLGHWFAFDASVSTTPLLTGETVCRIAAAVWLTCWMPSAATT